MFTNIRGLWGFLGVGLALVALYLLLEHSDGTAKILAVGTGGIAGIYRTLQGR